MIRISLTPQQLSTTRFTVSPLLHLVSGLANVRRSRPAPPWLREGWERLSPASRTTLEQVIDPAARYIPDFLTPVPAGPSPSIESELDAVRATPSAVLRVQLSRYLRLGEVNRAYAAARGFTVDEVEGFRTEPTEREVRAWEGEASALTAPVADALAEAWSTMLVPRWPQLRAALETDVLHHTGRAAAVGMTQAVLDIVEASGWDGVTADVGSHVRADVSHHDGELVLAPRALVVDRNDFTIVLGARLGDFMVVYPCRGRASIPRPQSAGRDAISTLLPGTRGQVLRAVDQPTPGHLLATTLAVSPATVSYHLDRLRQAGLVEARRRGKEVLYVQTDTARRLTGP